MAVAYESQIFESNNVELKEHEEIDLSPVFEENTSSNSNYSNKNQESPKLHSKKNVSKRKNKKVKEDVFIQKKPRMKTAKEVVNRIKWDEVINSEDVSVVYWDRHFGMIEKPFEELNWNDDIATTGPNDPLVLPGHRIYIFKWKNIIFWDRKARIDNMFGSTGGGKKIEDIIKRFQEQKENSEFSTSEEPHQNENNNQQKLNANFDILTTESSQHSVQHYDVTCDETNNRSRDD